MTSRSRGRTSGGSAGVMPPCGQPKRERLADVTAVSSTSNAAADAEPGEPTPTADASAGPAGARPSAGRTANSLRPPGPASLARRRLRCLLTAARSSPTVADYSTLPGSGLGCGVPHYRRIRRLRRRVTVRLMKPLPCIWTRPPPRRCIRWPAQALLAALRRRLGRSRQALPRARRARQLLDAARAAVAEMLGVRAGRVTSPPAARPRLHPAVLGVLRQAGAGRRTSGAFGGRALGGAARRRRHVAAGGTR